MYDNKDCKWLITLVMVVFFSSATSQGEIDIQNYNNYNGTNPPTQEQVEQAQERTNSNLNGQNALDINSYGGLMQGTINRARAAQGSAGQIASDTSTQDDPAKKTQSGQKSDSGAAAAATAGGIMIGTGSAMLPSPIIPVSIAGANLIAMGIVELAQSAASKNAGDNNHANSAYLKRTENDTGSQSNTPVDYNSALTPQARQTLENAGINPEDFMNKAATGQLGGPGDIAKMFGINDFTDEQLAEAKGLLDNQLNSVFDEKTSLLLDESQKNKTAAEMGAGPASAAASSAYQANAGRAAGSTSGSASGATHSDVTGSSAVSKRTDLVPPTVPMDSKEWSNVLSQLGVPADAAPWEKKAMAEARLAAAGIELPQRGVNIFHKASMRYRKFSDWRKAKSVAAR